MIRQQSDYYYWFTISSFINLLSIKDILKSWFRKHKSNSLSPNEKRLKSYIMIMVMGIISIWVLRGRWFLHSCEFQSKQKIILQSHYILFHKIDKLTIVNLFTNKMRFCLFWCILVFCHLMFLKSLNQMVSNYCLEIFRNPYLWF